MHDIVVNDDNVATFFRIEVSQQQMIEWVVK